jgi:2-polyprenyl-3-methyl-5-hydroxy-6-metoxy-1,4-benzoquinol methylase
MENYLELNRKMWDDRVEPHLGSELYNMEDFLTGATSLNQIELDLLGDVSGKSILHLQCHFGQDSLSLARMGASVTGVDFSEKAIATARSLSERLRLQATFICSDVLQLTGIPAGSYDLVYSTYGTVTWLPELTRWADIIQRALKPGGKLLLVEFHPAVWMFDDHFNEVLYGYFNSGPIIEEVEGSYATRNMGKRHTAVGWNHSLDEVIAPLLENGLQLTHFREYAYSPYDVLHDMIRTEKGFELRKMPGKLPLIYSLIVKK